MKLLNNKKINHLTIIKEYWQEKGDKDYSKSEKQLLISLINDYSFFEAHDHEIIQILSKK